MGCLRRDEEAAGRIAANELFKLGYRRAVYIAGTPAGVPHYSHGARHDGFIGEASRLGLDTRFERFENSADETESLGWLEGLRPDDVVVAATHYHARKLQTMLGYAGLRPGRDVGVACLDEVGETRSTWQTLARVSFDRWRLEVQAAAMLRQCIDGDGPPDSITFSCDWRPGQSAPGTRRP